MKLLKPLPQDRTYKQVLNHYLVEKAIADKLKSASREERKVIYATMYDELFRQVPDHPRLIRRKDERLTQIENESKLSLVRNFLNASDIFVEFAPGDCRFAMEVARYVKRVYAVDISDQRDQTFAMPRNFSLLIYDGYTLDKIHGSSVDLVFSDQLIEHLHPEDTKLHFELVYHILKPGGKYVFRTPHAFMGPSDVSMFFSRKPQGFHLKEWTYTELNKLLKELHFKEICAISVGKNGKKNLPYIYYQLCECMINMVPGLDCPWYEPCVTAGFLRV